MKGKLFAAFLVVLLLTIGVSIGRFSSSTSATANAAPQDAITQLQQRVAALEREVAAINNYIKNQPGPEKPCRGRNCDN